MATLESLRPAVDAQQGRRRVLRAEARIRAARRDRPRLAVRHRPGRPQPAGPARRVLHRRALQQGDAGDAAPRDVRLAGALHRHSHRALSPATSRCGSRRPRRRSHHRLRRRRLRAARWPSRARRAGLRVELDLRNEKINYKVREHSLAKVPVLLVVGKKEAETRTVSIRRLGGQEQKVMGLDEALAELAEEAVPPDVRRVQQAGEPRGQSSEGAAGSIDEPRALPICAMPLPGAPSGYPPRIAYQHLHRFQRQEGVVAQLLDGCALSKRIAVSPIRCSVARLLESRFAHSRGETIPVLPRIWISTRG